MDAKDAAVTTLSPARRWRLRLLLTMLATGLMGLAFVLAELGARRWSTVPPPAPWELDHARRTERNNTHCEIPPRREGRRRVVVVGESSAAMLASLLQRRQERASEPLDIVDCALAGSALEHLPRRVDDALRARPDAVVLLFAHNLAFAGEARPQVVALQRLARRSMLVRAITGAPSPLVDHRALDRVATFEQVLDTAARDAAGRGVRMVYVAPVGNLWYAPWEPSSTQTEAVLRARVRIALGHRDEGLELLRTSESAVALFERALLASASGDEGGAFTALLAALQGSWSNSNRAPFEATEAVRRVARRHGLGLVDAESIARAWYPPAPDWRHFVDACHPTPAVMTRIAREVERVVAPQRVAPPVDASPTGELELAGTLDVLLRLDPRQREFAPWMRSVAAAVPQWLVAPDGEAKLDAWLSAFEQRPVSPGVRAFVLAGVAHGLSRAGRSSRAAALYARSPPPEGPWVAVEWALWLLQEGRVAEARQLLTRVVDDAAVSPVRDELDRLAPR